MRVNLELPDHPILGKYHIPVRISDINYGNHTGNDSFVSIIHENRMQWLKQHHFTELNIEGIGLIMADLSIQFLHESYYGDMLSITLFAGEISNVSFELYYLLSVTREKEIIIAKAKTGMVCYDYTLKKVKAIPGKLFEILNPGDI